MVSLNLEYLTANSCFQLQKQNVLLLQMFEDSHSPFSILIRIASSPLLKSARQEPQETITHIDAEIHTAFRADRYDSVYVHF